MSHAIVDINKRRKITTHTFNIEDATKYGVSEAVFLSNIRYWVANNQYENINYHEGRYWTYNSRRKFKLLFPYWSDRQLRTIIDSLCKAGILIKGNFNTKNYDRTTWYSINEDWTTMPLDDETLDLTNKSDPLVKNDQGPLVESDQSALVKNDQPIPNIKLRTNNKQRTNKGKGGPGTGPHPTQIVEAFNEIVQGTAIPKVEKISMKRQDACHRLTKKLFPTIESWKAYFELIVESRFLTGDNDRNWTADIDFALTESKAIKILEGAYKNKIKMPPVLCRNQGLAQALGIKL